MTTVRTWWKILKQKKRNLFSFIVVLFHKHWWFREPWLFLYITSTHSQTWGSYLQLDIWDDYHVFLISRSSYPEVFLRHLFWKYVANLQENTHAEVWFQSSCCSFIEITLRHGSSPVNLLHIFRIPFPRNTSGWLLLYFIACK